MDAAALRIEQVMDEQTVSTCMRIINDAFSGFTFEQRLGRTAGPEGSSSRMQQRVQAWKDHFNDTGYSPLIQCKHTDPKTGEETVVACAEWYIYPRPQPRNDQRGPGYLLSGTWLPKEEAAKIQQTFKSTLDVRAQWTAGRGYGLLVYMATDPGWRRKGAASMCVQWGIDRCRELGIPAYLEASKEGAPVYQRLGFEIVEDVHMELDGKEMDFPAMMWWPPGTAEENKRKLAS